MEAVIQISEVNSKDVNTSRGVGTVYNVKAVDGKEFSTFKKDLGQQAGQLRGQWATVEYQEVQKGKYTNYYLDSVTPGVPENQPGYPVPSVENTAPSQGFPGPHTATVTAGGNAPGTLVKLNENGVSHNITYKDDKYRTPEQILREGALKAAVDTAVGLQMEDANSLTIINIARSYERWITDGEKASVKEPAPLESLSSGVDVESPDGILVDF